MTLTTHLHPVPTVRMSGDIPLRPSMPSGRVKGQRYFIFTCRTAESKLNEEHEKWVRTGWTSGVPRNFVRGGVQQIRLRTEDRENGGLEAAAP